MREREEGARNIEEAFSYCNRSKDEQVGVGIRLHLPDRCLNSRTITETVKINGRALKVIKNLLSVLPRMGQEECPRIIDVIHPSDERRQADFITTGYASYEQATDILIWLENCADSREEAVLFIRLLNATAILDRHNKTPNRNLWDLNETVRVSR